MGYIKKFVEFICEKQQEDLYDAQKIVLTLKDGFEQKKKWDAFKKSEFNDIAVLKKGKYGLRLDLRIDGGEEYKWNNHLPCVYFRNGEGDMDFLPMIICNKPYIPYPFVQNISDEELLWIYRFVLRNKKLLLKYANSKISSLYLFNRINENAEVSYVNEGSGKISEQDSGLSRCVWIGPYENTNHYLRLKIQTPKSSSISEEWASLTIPDLEIKKERGEYDLTGKEELAVKRFAIINKEALDDFAKDVIDFDEGYKYAVVQIIKEDISLVGDFYWTVCSDTIEHLYENNGGVKIPNDYIELFIGKYKSLSDDGYHFYIEVPDGDGEMEDVKKIIFGFNSKETFEHIKNKNDERIMKYINRITNITIKDSVYVKNLSKEDYYTEVVYVFYEDRVDGFKDYSNKTMNILKEAVEYLKKFVELNKNNKDIDIRKYSTAIWNGENLIATATIMDIHNDIII